jgi:hypothetical protein
MANLWITEYSGAADERTQVFSSPANGRQTVTIGSEAKSNAFGAATHYVRLKALADCIYVISAADNNGTFQAASTTVGDYLSSGDIECIGVKPGMKISVISTTGS